MFVVKADNPDVGYAVTPGEVTDSEGNTVDSGTLDIKVESDNPEVVEITPGADGAARGTAHFGKPGDAAVTVTVSKGDAVLGKFGAQFHVTAGDPARIAGGSISFEGLTES